MESFSIRRCDFFEHIPTSDQELLAVYPGISLGFLQQADPVVHLLRCVTVAVDHSVRSDDDKGVGPAGGEADERITFYNKRN